MGLQVKLKWIQFRKWKDVLDSEDGKYEFPCVYILSDKDGTPLYIGQAARERKYKNGKLRAGGLRARYNNAVAVLDASMAGTGRHIFIAEVEPKLAGKIEKQLIYENKPDYNLNSKANPPKEYMKMIHQGTPPNLSSRT